MSEIVVIRSKQRWIALLLVLAAVVIGGTAYFIRTAAANAREHRTVQTRALIYALAGVVALSSSEVPPGGTDQIVSVLGETSGELEENLLVDLTVQDGHILDAWGNPIRIMELGDDLALVSCGPNGTLDGGQQDDIVERFATRRHAGPKPKLTAKQREQLGRLLLKGARAHGYP